MGALSDFFVGSSTKEEPSSGDFGSRLDKAKAAYKEQFGKDMPITSQVRTREEQQRLYDDYKKGKPGIYMPVNPADFPNKQTFHQSAADIPASVSESFLNQFGIHRPHGKRDPVHAVAMSQEPEQTLSSFFSGAPPVEEQQGVKAEDLSKPFVGYPSAKKPMIQRAPEEPSTFGQVGKEMGQRLASLADVTVGGIVPSVAGPLTYAGARALGGARQIYGRMTGTPQEGVTPEQAAELQQKVVSATDNPFGKAFGITESPAYKGEASRQIMEFVGQNASKGAAWISEKTGIPVSDVENMMGTALVAATPTLAKVPGQIKEMRNVRSQLENQFAQRQAEAGMQPGATAPGMTSMGSAAAVPENVLRGNIDAAVAQASPELQAHVQMLNPRAVHLPALETKALEEKHGVNLITSQRIGDTNGYSEAWNHRAKNGFVGDFEQQPKQLAQAFEQSKIRHASRISSEADASELGQYQINGLAEKDAMRLQGIEKAYQDFRDKYVELRQAAGLPVENDFPVNGNAFLQNAKKALVEEQAQYDVPEAIKNLMKDIEDKDGKMTFSEFINFDKRLSKATKEGHGSEKAAAFIIRQQLQNIPLEAEAAVLEPMYRNAVSLAKERFDTIANIPAYRAAIGEAADLKELASQGESLNAANFHKKFVSNATPEAIRRMKAELPEDHIAHDAMAFGELERAKRAITNANETRTKADTFADFIRNNKSKLREALPPEAMQDVMEIGLLNSKIGKPEAGTFNYSNTYSSVLGDLAKEGLLNAAEFKLASATSGLSVPAVAGAKALMQKFNKDAFANYQRNPYGGLTKDLNAPQTPVRIDLRGMANKD